MGTSKNPKLCVTLHRQNAHLPFVNSAFASVASLDFGVFRGALIFEQFLTPGYFTGILNEAARQRDAICFSYRRELFYVETLLFRDFLVYCPGDFIKHHNQISGWPAHFTFAVEQKGKELHI
jgi:hypothetical protein